MDDLFLDTYYFFVLIETYWNVKLYDKVKNRSSMVVLIETYWNVKDPRIILSVSAISY